MSHNGRFLGILANYCKILHRFYISTPCILHARSKMYLDKKIRDTI